MKIAKHLGIVLLLMISLAGSLHGWTNDLRITSIVRTNDCTTLTWKSHPGEFYNVYWTTNLNGNPFWRVAAIHVPSQGTNTTWTECEAGEGMMMAGGGELSTWSESKSMTYEEAKERIEANRPAYEATIRYLEELLAEAAARPRVGPGVLAGPSSNPQTQSFAPDPPGDGGGTSTNEFNPSYKFYRVARVAVTGFVDGWGQGLGTIPNDLTNAIAISAGPYDSGAHNLALLSNSTVRAWGNNAFGQCNVPSGLSNVIAVSAGGRHSIAAKQDGTIVV